ncbi:MAG: hypothetical protein M1833_007348 [Piccolia ochrophora]|nr:MAG: hypothetical protein M1833_007348 [Piccolia ochrophora]
MRLQICSTLLATLSVAVGQVGPNLFPSQVNVVLSNLGETGYNLDYFKECPDLKPGVCCFKKAEHKEDNSRWNFPKPYNEVYNKIHMDGLSEGMIIVTWFSPGKDWDSDAKAPDACGGMPSSIGAIPPNEKQYNVLGARLTGLMVNPCRDNNFDVFYRNYNGTRLQMMLGAFQVNSTGTICPTEVAEAEATATIYAPDLPLASGYFDEPEPSASPSSSSPSSSPSPGPDDEPDDETDDEPNDRPKSESDEPETTTSERVDATPSSTLTTTSTTTTTAQGSAQSNETFFSIFGIDGEGQKVSRFRATYLHSSIEDIGHVMEVTTAAVCVSATQAHVRSEKYVLTPSSQSHVFDPADQTLSNSDALGNDLTVTKAEPFDHHIGSQNSKPTWKGGNWTTPCSQQQQQRQQEQPPSDPPLPSSPIVQHTNPRTSPFHVLAASSQTLPYKDVSNARPPIPFTCT